MYDESVEGYRRLIMMLLDRVQDLRVLRRMYTALNRIYCGR